jgi:PAS domain S-box-containing protein
MADAQKDGRGNLPQEMKKADGAMPSRPTAIQQNNSLYLSSLVDNLSDAFIATDINFNITQWNKAAESMYGWRADEVLGHPIGDLIKTEYVEGDRVDAVQKITSAGIWSDKVFQNRKDGRKVFVFSTVSQVKSETGELLGLVAINRDITEQELAEERFRLAVESAPNAIIMVNQHGEIILLNSQTEKYFGYQRHELIGTSVDKLVPLRYTAIHPGHRADFLASPQMRNMGVGRDLYALRKDGSEFPVEIGLAPINTHEGTFVLATIVDITQRKKAEQDTHRLNKELEAFAYSVSHDLRAPLRGIDGFSSMLAQKYANNLDEQGVHYLSRIQANVHRMGQMIEDLLSLAKMTRHELKYETVNLSAMATEVLDELMLAEPGRTIKVEIEEQVETQCDVGLIRIVLQNLLGNSWKFTSKRDEALIQFGRAPRNKHGKPVFFVRDNGVGFAMAYSDKLFGAFQRLHTVNEFSGTGIGLATVQRIIHRHGGEIWAEAAQDQGATFFFTLGGAHGRS